MSNLSNFNTEFQAIYSEQGSYFSVVMRGEAFYQRRHISLFIASVSKDFTPFKTGTIQVFYSLVSFRVHVASRGDGVPGRSLNGNGVIRALTMMVF